MRSAASRSCGREDRFARRRARQIEKLLAQGAGKKPASERRREQTPVELDKEIGPRALGELALAVEEHDLVAAGERLLPLHLLLVELPPRGLVVEERVLLIEAPVGDQRSATPYPWSAA